MIGSLGTDPQFCVVFSRGAAARDKRISREIYANSTKYLFYAKNIILRFSVKSCSVKGLRFKETGIYSIKWNFVLHYIIVIKIASYLICNFKSAA